MTTTSSNGQHQGKGVHNWKTFFLGFRLPHEKGDPSKLTSFKHRIAYLLDWVAKRSPYSFVPYNVVFKEINQLPQTPRMDNVEVKRLRSKMTAARPVLQEQFGRDLVSLSDVGVRATVDDDDVVRATTPRAVSRYASAKKSLSNNVNLVDVTKLTAGPEKTWFQSSVRPAVLALKNDPRLAKLLPPAAAAPAAEPAEKK